MNTKEKLELLWKYLFLLVVAIGIFQLTNRSHPAPKHFGQNGNHEMVFFSGDDHKMDVKIEQEIIDGDTLMKVVVNGEEVAADDYDMKEGNFKWKSKSGNVMVIDIDDDNNDDHKEKVVRIIKKKIIMRDGK